MAQFTPSLGIVTGVAAGLKPEWQPGDLLAAQSVLGPDGEERIPGDPALIDLAVQCGAKPAPALITLPRIARTMAEKVRLASLGDAADMESLILMKQWSARGIPSLALRVILDAVEMPMTCDFEAAFRCARASADHPDPGPVGPPAPTPPRLPPPRATKPPRPDDVGPLFGSILGSPRSINQAGRMFWLTLKKLAGSYFVLRVARRA